MKVLPNTCFAIILFILLCSLQEIKAQNILNKKFTIAAHQQKLGKILSTMEQQGNFRFSYNSTILPLDSLVTINVVNLSGEEILDRLLKRNYEYHQTYDFLIIRYAPLQLTLIVQESYGNQNQYVITGKVVDEQSRKPIANASIYEKNLLQSTLTNADGLFTLKLKHITQTIALTASKLNYKEVTSYFLPEITIYKNEKKTSSAYADDTSSALEKTFLGRVFITPRQKIQTLNTGGFIASAPAQFSLGPGISSHGSLSGQVVNKFSFNTTGDYSAGVDGMEIGLLFNIDKKNVRYFQLGGAFNLVGGKVTGMQISGFYNYVLKDYDGLQISTGYNRVAGDFNGFQIGGLYNNVHQNLKGVQVSVGHNTVKKSVIGLQIGGFYNQVLNNFNGVEISVGHNRTKGQFKGLQFGGLFNTIGDDLNGVQFSLGYNRTKNRVKGLQISSVSLANQIQGAQVSLLGNFVRNEVKGLQFGGLFNYSKKLSGLQIGLINMADSSSGYSIGLINLIRKGYHKMSISTNESIDVNAAIKTGNHKMYTQFLFGKNLNPQQKLLSIGLGIGKDFNLGKNFSLNPEITSRYVYQGDWKYKNILHRLDVNMGYRLTKWAAISAGPALNMYYTTQNSQVTGYDFIGNKYDRNQTNKRYQGWLGWNVGITLF